MPAWRLAGSLFQLKSEFNGLWPRRDRTSDGSIGDPDHAGRNSDHNPNEHGVVTAHDFDDDIAADDTLPFRIAEHLRNLGKSGFRPLHNGGYIIYYRKICSEKNNWAWRDYNGVNAHASHIHVSTGNSPVQYDSPNSWRLKDVIYRPQPLPPPTPKAKDSKMYVLIKGKDQPEVFLTDMMMKRELHSQEEINFTKYVLNAGGALLKNNGEIETWPQEMVDSLGHADNPSVDATLTWYAAQDSGTPMHDLIGQVLETPAKAKAAAKKSAS